MEKNKIIELNPSRPFRKHPFLSMEILRTFLNFLIVVYHCFNSEQYDYKIIDICIQAAPFYFPTLFLFHFYFSYVFFGSRNLTKIKERFIRILIPYIIWPLIFWIGKYILNDNKRVVVNEEAYKELFTQIVIGRGVYFVFWFQFNLLFITFIIAIVVLFTKKYSLYIFQVIFLISYILEYSAFLEKNIFVDYSEDIKRSVGRTLKMITFSMTGHTLASIKALHFLKRYRSKSMFISFCILVFVVNYKIFFIRTYFFEGLILNVGAISLFTFFYMIPLDKMTNININFLIKQITNFTAGVYCLHYKIQDYLEHSIDILKQKTLRGCVLNYLLCYFLCFIGARIFGKTKLKFLFM